LIDFLTENCNDELRANIIFDVKFYLLGCGYFIVDWFLNGQYYSIEQLADYLCFAMPENLKPLLK